MPLAPDALQRHLCGLRVKQPCWCLAGRSEAGALSDATSGPPPGRGGGSAGACAPRAAQRKRIKELGPLDAGFVHPSGEVRHGMGNMGKLSAK